MKKDVIQQYLLRSTQWKSLVGSSTWDLGYPKALVPFASMHGRISGVVPGRRGRCAFPGGQLFLYSINIASKYKEPTGLQCCGRPQASFTDAHLARSHERNCLPECRRPAARTQQNQIEQYKQEAASDRRDPG